MSDKKIILTQSDKTIVAQVTKVAFGEKLDWMELELAFPDKRRGHLVVRNCLEDIKKAFIEDVNKALNT